jgi:hypothetical protein
VVASSDGVHWTNQALGVPVVFTDLAYGNGIFVASAFGTLGGIYVSTDAMMWARQFTNTLLEGVTFGGGLFVAVGQGNTTLTSPDGTNWTARSSGTALSFQYTAAYGNGLFAIAGFPGTVIETSPDGVTWTNRTTDFGASISGLLFANGSFVAAADNGVVLTSTDGIAWGRRPRKASKNLWAVAYGQSTYVVVGDNGTIIQSASSSIPVLTATNSESLGFQLSLTGEIGRAYRIQAVTNISSTDWQDIAGFTNTTATMLFLDSNTTNFPQRFYRAVSP